MIPPVSPPSLDVVPPATTVVRLATRLQSHRFFLPHLANMGFCIGANQCEALPGT